LTWRCDFPQKLQRSCSLVSVGRASGLPSWVVIGLADLHSSRRGNRGVQPGVTRVPSRTLLAGQNLPTGPDRTGRLQLYGLTVVTAFETVVTPSAVVATTFTWILAGLPFSFFLTEELAFSLIEAGFDELNLFTAVT